MVLQTSFSFWLYSFSDKQKYFYLLSFRNTRMAQNVEIIVENKNQYILYS